MVAGTGEKEGMQSQNTEDFQDSETILCDTLMVDICHYTFFQIHRIHTTKSECYVKYKNYGLINYGLWLCVRVCLVMSDSVSPWTVACQIPLSIEFLV